MAMCKWDYVTVDTRYDVKNDLIEWILCSKSGGEPNLYWNIYIYSFQSVCLHKALTQYYLAL